MGVSLVFAIFTMLTMVLSTSLQRGQMLNIAETSWTGEVGGYAFQLNGTAHSVWAQLKAKHPEIELPKNNSAALAALDTHATRNKVPPSCLPMRSHPDWQQASIFNIGICVGYLLGINVRINIGAGWGTCVQICCDDADSVFLCNDNPYSIQPASPYLGSYASNILNACWNGDDNYLAGGQEFDTDDCNIVVRGNGGAGGSC